MRVLYRTLLFILVLSQSGCSLFLGNIKPIEEKSTNYGVSELSKDHPDWIRLDSKSIGEQKGTELQETGISDIVYQSQKTGSVISLNSVCKSYKRPENQEVLKKMSNELLLGISDIVFKEEKQIEVAGAPALQTTVKGTMNSEKMMLRTIVLKRGECLYDLMYVARPERFKETEKDFSQFVSSLHIR